jgi:hypothetical protein
MTISATARETRVLLTQGPENAAYRSRGGEYGGPLGRPYYMPPPEPEPPPPCATAPRHGWGPLSPKGKCEDDCWATYIDDSRYCERLPKPQQRACKQKAFDKFVNCVRDCSRKYPDPRLPKGD